MNKNSKIYIAGHNGMVGSACVRVLKSEGYVNIITRSSKQLDLRCQNSVKVFLETTKPDLIIDAAARVGGIKANNEYPYQFLMDNMLIQNNLIKYAHELNVEKFIFLGSSCIYPRLASQPIKEEYLLSGSLESTNECYAIAKISGLKLIESLRNQYNKKYTSLMPTNLYGFNDNFDLNNSHVLPALIRKFHEAKENGFKSVTLWGDGSAFREFLFADDLAYAVLMIMKLDKSENIYNVGSGEELKISSLAKLIKEIIGFQGQILWDTSKPNGTPRKILDSSKINKIGFRPKFNLNKGIKDVYKWYLENIDNLRD